MTDMINGVNLSTGKLSLPITLSAVTGPAGFGESVVINYSTTGLLQQVKTWNEDAPTGILGLGWNLQTPYIMRMGNGNWQDKFFLVAGGSSLPLILVESPLITKDYNNLKFVTQGTSLLQITYQVDIQTWTIRDGDGTLSTYGGKLDNDTYNTAVEWGIRWQSTADNQPAVWIGSSTEVSGQYQYAIVWRLSKKQTLSGQQINYDYNQIQLNVGPELTIQEQIPGNPVFDTTYPGLSYTMANYLKSINVVGGGRIEFDYMDKELWEHPQFHFSLKSGTSLLFGTNGENKGINAYQDRIETKYLSSLTLYDAYDKKINYLTLNYKNLYDYFNSGNRNNLPDSSIVNQMNKRLLTSITTFTGEGVQMLPSQEFDYWGLQDTALQNQIGTHKDQFKALQNPQISRKETITQYEAVYTYNALLGHLKTIKSSQGALTYYSYSDNSQDSNGQPKSALDWKLQLDFKLIAPKATLPTGQTVTWSDPKPYWGGDQYVVIRWQTNFNKRNWICIQIYEWIGKWIQVEFQQKVYNSSTIPNPSKDLVFHVSTFDEINIKFNMSVGKFALVRTDISQDNTNNPYGNLTLFHRDLYMPGLWNSVYFQPKTSSSDSLLPIPITKQPGQEQYDDNPYKDTSAYLHLNTAFGEDIFALLDIISGRLHLYSLSNNEWHPAINSLNTLPSDQNGIIITAPHVMLAYPSGDIQVGFPSTCSTLGIRGNSVFVMSNEIVDLAGGKSRECNLYYYLFQYDNTQPLSSNWLKIHDKVFWNQNVIEDITDNRYRGVARAHGVKGLVASASEAYIVLQIIVATTDKIVSRLVIVSWDEVLDSVVTRFLPIKQCI